MARLKIGFIPIEGGHYYKDALEEVTRAEELGFDSVWMEEHHAVTNHYWPSPFPVLAGFATRTSKMMLGTDIAVAAFYHPVRLAEDVAMLDVMSNGRVTLGIAIGYKPDEFALYGVNLEKRGARRRSPTTGFPVRRPICRDCCAARSSFSPTAARRDARSRSPSGPSRAI